MSDAPPDVLRPFVSQELIDACVPRDSDKCIFSEAIKQYVRDTLGLDVNVNTDYQSIVIGWPNGFHERIFTPEPCQQIQILWDLGDKPDPFSFTLKVNGPGLPTGPHTGGGPDDGGEHSRRRSESRPAPTRTPRKTTTKQTETPQARGVRRNSQNARRDRIMELAEKLGPTTTIPRDERGMPIIGQAMKVRIFGSRSFVR
jgi:hypothetical protein